MRVPPPLGIGLPSLCALCLALFLVVPSAQAQTFTSTQIIAGQHIPVGTFDLTFDGTDFLFEYRITDPEWCLGVVHLYAGVTPPKKAAPGRFPFHGDAHCGDRFTFRIPVTTLGTSGFFLAAHAEVQQGAGSRGGREETAWAAGPFPFKNGWGSYSAYVPE
jgi:hypothetical protein